MPTTVYGDISPRTAAYASKELLERANPLLVLERFGQAKPLPRSHAESADRRRHPLRQKDDGHGRFGKRRPVRRLH